MGKAKREKILEQVKELVVDEISTRPAKLYLFGSWARGEEKHSSDIDIAVEQIREYDKYLITKIRLKLEESNIPYRVDVVDLSATDQNFNDRVKKEGILWKD